MAEYIIREADFSGNENDVIVIDEESQEDREFIDDDEGVEFYRSVSKKFSNDEGTLVPVVKEDTGRLRLKVSIRRRKDKF